MKSRQCSDSDYAVCRDDFCCPKPGLTGGYSRAPPREVTAWNRRVTPKPIQAAFRLRMAHSLISRDVLHREPSSVSSGQARRILGNVSRPVWRQGCVSLKFVRPTRCCGEARTWTSQVLHRVRRQATHIDAKGLVFERGTAFNGEEPRRMEYRRVSQRGCEADCDRPPRAPYALHRLSTVPQKAQKIFYFYFISFRSPKLTLKPLELHPTIIGLRSHCHRSPWTLGSGRVRTPCLVFQ